MPTWQTYCDVCERNLRMPGSVMLRATWRIVFRESEDAAPVTVFACDHHAAQLAGRENIETFVKTR